MVDLRSYIGQMQQKGYTIPQIRQWLLQNGYPQGAVDQALYNSQTQVHHTFHLGKTALIAIIVVVLGLVAASLFIFSGDSSPEQLLDVSISGVSRTVESGDDVSFLLELINMGSSGRFDVNVKTEVFDENNNRVTFKSETLALSTTATKEITLNIPKGVSGRHTLTVTARYQGEVATASEQFTIEGAPAASCSDGIQNGEETGIDCGGICGACRTCGNCDDNDPRTRDYCSEATNYECRHEIQALCGDGICSPSENSASCQADCTTLSTTITSTTSPWDTLDEVEKLAETNPSEALQECETIKPSFKDKCLEKVGETVGDASICDKITETYNKEKCFSNVAKETGQSVLCEQLSEKKRDSCYTNFVTKGDYTVCEKIQNTYLQESCIRLREANG